MNENNLISESHPILKALISIYKEDPITKVCTLIKELVVERESLKALTKNRAAKLLVNTVPQYTRQKGPFARTTGIAILPVLEEFENGWRAWRLLHENVYHSGYQPPLKGRVGKSNSKNNPFADRSKGIWECAVIKPYILNTID